MVKEDKRLWGSNFSREQIEETRKKGGLLSMELELSRECNLRCIYCYANSGKKLENELTLEEIFDALDQALELGARRIIIIGGGEPLMYPHTVEIMRYLHQKKTGIDLFTNGTLITRETAELLMELGVAPVIKMNSMKEDVQDMLANRPGTFKAIREGLENLLAAGYPHKDYSLGIETIICRQNIEELPQMWIWARERDIVPYFEMVTFQGRAKRHLNLNVTSDELHALFRELAKTDRERFGLEWEPHPPIAALSCNRHEYSCTINSQGYIQPCTGVDLTIGNIRHDRLEDIVGKSIVLDSLRRVRENIKGVCRDCSLNSQCYGCRGLAYHITGDFLASDPLCWNNPDKVS